MLTSLFSANCFQSHCLDPNWQDLGAHWVRWGAEGGLSHLSLWCRLGSFKPAKATNPGPSSACFSLERRRTMPLSTHHCVPHCFPTTATLPARARMRRLPRVPWRLNLWPLLTTFLYFQGPGVHNQGLSPKPGVGREEAAGKPEKEEQRSEPCSRRSGWI